MGYLLIVIASVMYGVGPTFATLMQKAGWSPATVLLEGQLVGAGILFVLIKWKGISLKLSRDQILPLFGWGSISYLVTSLLLQASYQYMLAGLCTMLHFVYPVVVMISMIIIYKERATPTKILCMMMSLIGICMIVGISNQTGDNVPLGALLAVSSGIAYAFFVMANDKSAMAEIHSFVSVFYVLLSGALLVGAYLLLAGKMTASFDRNSLILAVMYPISTVVALVCLSNGVRRIGATKAAIINMLEPAVSMIVSIAVFGGKNVTVQMLAGCVLILASVIIVTLTKNSGQTAGKGSN